MHSMPKARYLLLYNCYVEKLPMSPSKTHREKQDIIIIQLAMLARILKKTIDGRNLGMRVLQYQALDMISRDPHLSQNDIVKILCSNPSSIAKNIRNMCEKGWIIKKKRGNKKTSTLMASPEGKRHFAIMQLGMQKIETHLEQHLSHMQTEAIVGIIKAINLLPSFHASVTTN